MTLNLPNPVAAYFAADRSRDAAAVARCFAEGATVRDEGGVHEGREAIRRWKAAASAKFGYSVEPFAMAVEGGRTVVSGHVSGDFPGSPVDLRYSFGLAGEEIAALEITL